MMKLFEQHFKGRKKKDFVLEVINVLYFKQAQLTELIFKFKYSI